MLKTFEHSDRITTGRSLFIVSGYGARFEATHAPAEHTGFEVVDVDALVACGLLRRRSLGWGQWAWHITPAGRAQLHEHAAPG